MKKTNKWKNFAIGLLVLLVLETIFIINLFVLGNEYENKETECSYNVCENAETYYYDPYEDVCYCFIDEEIVTQRYLG